MNYLPRSHNKIQRNQPRNSCWVCGRSLVVNASHNLQYSFNEKISYGHKVYGYICKPLCTQDDEDDEDDELV